MSREIIQLTGQNGRLDKVVSELLPKHSRTTIQKLIKQEHILVDGQKQKANYKLEGNECLEIQLSSLSSVNESFPEIIEPEEMPLDIIYEDEYVLVINKPQGLVVHPSKGHLNHTLVNGLLFYLNQSLSSNGESYRPGLVHRIDKDTSGLLVIAKDNYTHQKLSEQLIDHTMNRTYLALVHGYVKEEKGTIRVPLKRDSTNRLRWRGDVTGKDALTHFTVIERYPHVPATLLSLQLETGRTHQIRVHMEYIQHPIIGDSVYREGVASFKNQLTALDDGQYLHAQKLTFIHPMTKEKMTFEAPVPERMQKLIQTLKQDE